MLSDTLPDWPDRSRVVRRNGRGFSSLTLVVTAPEADEMWYFRVVEQEGGRWACRYGNSVFDTHAEMSDATEHITKAGNPARSRRAFPTSPRRRHRQPRPGVAAGRSRLATLADGLRAGLERWACRHGTAPAPCRRTGHFRKSGHPADGHDHGVASPDSRLSNESWLLPGEWADPGRCTCARPGQRI